MVRRAYGRKRRGRGKYSRRYSAPSSKRIARVAKNVVSRLSETKEKIYPYTAVGGGAASFASISYGNSCMIGTLCAGISQGTTGDTRIGRSIYVRGVKIYMAFQPGDNTNYLRLLLVQPKGQTDQANNGAFVAELLSSAVSSGTQWANPVDTDKYHVFFDKTLMMRYVAQGTDGTSVPSLRLVKRYIKINRKIEFATNNGPAAIKDLFFLGISDSEIVSHPGAVAGHVKVYFKDI